LTILISLYVFAKFEYDGDRFHWPAIALLLPALAVSFDWAQKALKTALLAALLPVLAFLAAVPFIHIGVSAVLVLLNLMMIAALVCLATLVVRRLVPEVVAVVVTSGLFLLPMTRDVILHGGSHLLAVTFLFLALELGLRRRWKFTAAASALAVAWILYVIFSGGVLIPKRSPALLMPLLIPLAWLFSIAAQHTLRLYERWPKRRWWWVAGAVAVLLVVVGTVRLARTAAEPFRIGSEKTLVQARVQLGDIPCDFLPWEHMSWECSHLDRGHFNQVGLALPDGVRVGGRQEEMLLIPTGLRSQDRRVSWPDAPVGRTLVLRHAAPDHPKGGVEVTVELDGEELDRFQTPESPDGRVHARRIDTSRFEGKNAELRIQVHALQSAGAAVALDGAWE
jgi:hypothetical protein